jgi:protoporphyrin/coproporphyrin ferrochelatase
MDMTQSKDPAAVVLLQLGGPDSPEAVEPFLYNLFRDPDIINFPGAFLARRFIAKMISSRRSKFVVENYRMIGGKSPILDLTRAQASALEKSLREEHDVRVFIAMRYWHPLTEETIAELLRGRYGRIILLPLYPQYCRATTASSLNEWRRQIGRTPLRTLPSEEICCYHNHPLYISSIVGKVTEAYSRFKNVNSDEIDIIFSAHGVPISFVKSGDPYRDQITETVGLVMERGRWPSPHTLCYQSKVGPVEWLRPSLTETVEKLCHAGRKRLLIVPIAFVTDHIETLHEINIESRKEALALGAVQFEVMPALNDSPEFIACLRDLVVKNL